MWSLCGLCTRMLHNQRLQMAVAHNRGNSYWNEESWFQSVLNAHRTGSAAGESVIGSWNVLRTFVISMVASGQRVRQASAFFYRPFDPDPASELPGESAQASAQTGAQASNTPTPRPNRPPGLDEVQLGEPVVSQSACASAEVEEM